MVFSDDIYGKSNSELIMSLGKRFKEYRLTVRRTQREVSESSGVSLFTIRAFENGKASNINMGNFLSLLRAIGMLDEFEKILPSIPLSPDVLTRIENKKPKRVRHDK